MKNELSAKFKENADKADFSYDSTRQFAADILADSIENNPSSEHLQKRILFIIDMIAENSQSDAFFTTVHLIHSLAEKNFSEKSDILFSLQEKMFNLSDNAIYDGRLKKIVSRLRDADSVIVKSLDVSRNWASQAAKLINQCAIDGQDGAYEAYHVALEFIRHLPEWNEIDSSIQNYDDPHKYALVTRVGHHDGLAELIFSRIVPDFADRYNGLREFISSILDSDSSVPNQDGTIPDLEIQKSDQKPTP